MPSVQALTTTFTPAPSCTADWYTSSIYYSIGGPSPSECFPSGWASKSQYYSPGLCPTGYSQACTNVVVVGTISETQATCCPYGWECYTPTIFNFPGQACNSAFTSLVTTTVTDAVAMTTETVTLHPSTEAVNGYGVSIRYQATDFASFTSNPSSTTSGSSPSEITAQVLGASATETSSSKSSTGSSASTGTTSSSPSTSTSTSSSSSTSTTSTSTDPGQPAPDSHPSTTTSTSSTYSSTPTATAASAGGLSAGAKAGIGGGIGGAALISIVGFVFFLLGRRSRKPQPWNYAQEIDSTQSGRPVFSVKEVKGVHEIFTPPSPPTELSGYYSSAAGRR